MKKNIMLLGIALIFLIRMEVVAQEVYRIKGYYQLNMQWSEMDIKVEMIRVGSQDKVKVTGYKDTYGNWQNLASVTAEKNYGMSAKEKQFEYKAFVRNNIVLFNLGNSSGIGLNDLNQKEKSSYSGAGSLKTNWDDVFIPQREVFSPKKEPLPSNNSNVRTNAPITQNSYNQEDSYFYNYNEGAKYFNQGLDIGKKINELNNEERQGKEKDGTLNKMLIQMRGYYSIATPYLEKCVKLAQIKAEGTDDSSLLNSLNALVYATINSENYNVAIPYLEQSMKQNPKSIPLLKLFTKFCQPTMSGKSNLVIPYFESAIKGNELNIEFLDILFDAYKNAKKYKEAIIYIERAANILENEVSLWENLSTLYYISGNKIKGDEIEKKIEVLLKKD